MSASRATYMLIKTAFGQHQLGCCRGNSGMGAVAGV